MEANYAQERQLSKLQNQISSIEQQMREHAALRRKLEELGDMETARTEKTSARVQYQNKLLQEDIERRYGTDSPIIHNSRNSKLLQEVMTLRTEEFQKSQAKKAQQIKHLAMERQRIMDARSRLKEKQEMMRSLPSPVGKGTHKHWGHKYSLYSPLPYDGGLRLYTPIRLASDWGTSFPIWDRSYFTYFPRYNIRAPRDSKRNVLYVPTPLQQSTFW